MTLLHPYAAVKGDTLYRAGTRPEEFFIIEEVRSPPSPCIKCPQPPSQMTLIIPGDMGIKHQRRSLLLHLAVLVVLLLLLWLLVLPSAFGIISDTGHCRHHGAMMVLSVPAPDQPLFWRFIADTNRGAIESVSSVPVPPAVVRVAPLSHYRHDTLAPKRFREGSE